MRANREIGIGIIGCGLMGREIASAIARWCHLLDLDFQPNLIAACDTNPKTLEWFENNFSKPNTTYKSYISHQDLLSDKTVQAVYCAIPHDLHETVYTDILKSGKHLLAEKSFGIDLQACKNIIAEANKHPELLVRISSEFPFFPANQRIARMIEATAFGKIIEVHASFCHSSDLDPNKPLNWKRRVATCGEYGVMGDLGLHVCHMPFRTGWIPKNVRALLSRIYDERPDSTGKMAKTETWDNATLACETQQGFPLVFETKRISPGETNTWTLRILGTELSVEYSTKNPKALRTLPYEPGGKQEWRTEDLGYMSAYPAITGGIFEFGFPDAILQMLAAFCDELVNGEKMIGSFRCATPDEALLSHQLFTAAIESQAISTVIAV